MAEPRVHLLLRGRVERAAAPRTRSPPWRANDPGARRARDDRLALRTTGRAAAQAACPLSLSCPPLEWARTRRGCKPQPCFCYATAELDFSVSADSTSRDVGFDLRVTGGVAAAAMKLPPLLLPSPSVGAVAAAL